MILVLSGEGPSDVGTETLTTDGWKFVAGPMAVIVDQLLSRSEKLNYSLLETHEVGAECVLFVSEGQLSRLRPSRPIQLPRGDDGFGNIFFRAQAYLLGKHVKEIATQRNEQAIAVLFRDGDGTRSMPREQWRQKFDSIVSGFRAADFQTGVPMVPRPKSEAWMLCGLLKHENREEACGWLEAESGNDASPNSLKRQLALHLGHELGHEPTAEEQAELVKSGHITPELIDLPSFTAFRDELDRTYAHGVHAN